MKNFDHRGRRRERDRGWWVGRAQSLRHNVWGRGVCRCWVRPVLTASRRVPSFQRRLSTQELHISRNISTIERESFFSSAVSDIKQIDGELRAVVSRPGAEPEGRDALSAASAHSPAREGGVGMGRRPHVACVQKLQRCQGDVRRTPLGLA